MTLRLMLAVLTTAVVLPLAVACTGGGGSGGQPVASTPTPDNFDYNKLTAIVLRPEDVPAGLPGLSGSFNTGTTNGVSFTTWYGTQSLQIQSTVGRYSDPVERDVAFDHIRRGIAQLAKDERNYNLAGADLAFIYRSPDAPVTSILAFRGDFFALLTQQSPDGTRAEDAYNEDALGGYMKIVFDRLQQLIANPDSVTPIPEAADYQSPTPGPPATATPEATAMP